MIGFNEYEQRLTFIKQTSFAIGNYKRRINGEKEVRAKALYKCSCGSIVELNIARVKRGQTKSCGCIEKENPPNKKHGLCKHKLYRIWQNIKKRCYDIKNPAYKNYGERGVIMCEEWKNDFISFYTWALNNGWNPLLQVDKDIIGTGFLYSPNSCKLVTPKENSNNRTSNVFITYKGERKTIADWSLCSGINAYTIGRRNRIGWSPKQIFETPIKKNNR